jgi:photosystem II stability/assembly factor-like uncharacterized protein
MDGGSTWAWASNGITESYKNVNTIVTDPTCPLILYTGVGGKLYRSNDGGESWSPTHEGYIGAVRELAIEQGDSTILYMATDDLGMFKSTDSGAFWCAINNGLPSDGYGNFHIEAMAMAPRPPGTLYLTVWTGGTKRKIFKTSDGGDSWAMVLVQEGLLYPLIVDPNEAQTVFAGTGGGGRDPEPRRGNRVD